MCIFRFGKGFRGRGGRRVAFRGGARRPRRVAEQERVRRTLEREVTVSGSNFGFL